MPPEVREISKTAVQALETALRRGVADVKFDAGSRALYATDSSNYRQVPIGIVRPRSVEDVVETSGCATSIKCRSCREVAAPA